MSKYPHAKVIMCSAMGQQGMVVEAIQSGAKDFIVKPFQADRVIDALTKILQVGCLQKYVYRKTDKERYLLQKDIYRKTDKNNNYVKQRDAVTSKDCVSNLTLVGASLLI